MTVGSSGDWPDITAINTPSSAASWGYQIAADIARINHPAARAAGLVHHYPAGGDVTLCCGRPLTELPVGTALTTYPERVTCNRADLLARVLPFADESEVGRSADRRRHGDRSRPATAAAEAGAASNPHSAGVRRGLIALACCFAVGWWLGRRW